VSATNQDSSAASILKNFINKFNRVTNRFRVKNRTTMKFFS